MQRLIYVPQYPSKLRYQEWWVWKLPEEFEKRGFEVKTLGSDYFVDKMSSYDPGMFSPINAAVEYETRQINEFMNLELRKDDILFLSDISFPGIFPNCLFHKKCSKMFVFCHGTSINNFDYYEKDKLQKFPIETSQAALFDKVFVGSYYHKRKLNWGDTVVVTYLPFPPFDGYPGLKVNDIISVSRPSKQKVDLKLENEVEKRFGKIYRPVSNDWNEYFENLSESKILLISAFEDTFGYQIVDAVMNGCIPLARDSFAYPELLPSEYLYRNTSELMKKIDTILTTNSVKVPKLLCEEEMNKFYDRICSYF